MTVTADDYAREITAITLGDEGAALDAMQRLILQIESGREFAAVVGGVAAFAGFAVRAAGRVGEVGVARILPDDLATTNATRVIASEVNDDEEMTVVHIIAVLSAASPEQIIAFVAAVVRESRAVLLECHTKDTTCPVCQTLQHRTRISACLYPGSMS